jgi:hypothetical protein
MLQLFVLVAAVDKIISQFSMYLLSPVSSVYTITKLRAKMQTILKRLLHHAKAVF